MAEELGKITKPEAGKFKKGRNLFFVPLVFTHGKPGEELGALTEKYWKQCSHKLRIRLVQFYIQSEKMQ